MSTKEVWQHKTDYELLAASRHLEEYTEDGQRVIRAEIERRSSPEYLLEQEAAQKGVQEAAQRNRRHSEKPITSWTTPGSPKAWLARRVLLAVTLMVGFYLFALAIALMLELLPKIRTSV